VQKSSFGSGQLAANSCDLLVITVNSMASPVVPTNNLVMDHTGTPVSYNFSIFLHKLSNCLWLVSQPIAECLTCSLMKVVLTQCRKGMVGQVFKLPQELANVLGLCVQFIVVPYSQCWSPYRCSFALNVSSCVTLWGLHTEHQKPSPADQ
jgi:hypothetical protein